MSRPKGSRKAHIIKTCLTCDTTFTVPPSLGKQKFCSKKCFDIKQSTGERKEIKCAECGSIFVGKKDHGRWPKFCSRYCYNESTVTPQIKPCPVCKNEFLAKSATHNTTDGLRIYCSNKCKFIGLKTGEEKKCLNCGGLYYLNRSKTNIRNDQGCCSKKCQHEYYIKDRSKAWKGGEYIDTTSNTKRVYFPENPTVQTHWGEHRIMASKIIGRLLMKNEYVLHINGDKMDTRPSNLYICSNSIFSKMRQGSLPWPKISNLDTYK